MLTFRPNSSYGPGMQAEYLKKILYFHFREKRNFTANFSVSAFLDPTLKSTVNCFFFVKKACFPLLLFLIQNGPNQEFLLHKYT